MDISQIERDLYGLDRLSQLESIVRALSLECKIDWHTNSVASASLYDSTGRLVAEGAGKGKNCLIGSIAEALEHYAASNEKPDIEYSIPTTFLAHQNKVAKDGLLIRLLDFNEPIPCFRFIGIESSEEIYVPTRLVSPFLVAPETGSADNFLCRYSTNSGCAFGLTLNEAILHGINESVERHIVSKIFMQISGLEQNIKLEKISTENIDWLIDREALNWLERKGFCVFILHDFFGLNFSIAICDGIVKNGLALIGSGCSCNKLVSISRAISELWQSCILLDSESAEKDIAIARTLNKYPRLKNLISCKIPSKSEYKPSSQDYSTPVAEQISSINKSITKSGHSIFYRIIRKLPEDGFVIQTYIPGLERFNLIRAGAWVVPQHVLLGSNVRRELHE